MRASTIVLGTVVTLVSAQRMADSLPDCAVDCLEKGIESATNCSVDDGDCICEVDNYRNTYDASTACVLQACGAAKALGKSQESSTPCHRRLVGILLSTPLPLTSPSPSSQLV